YALARPWMAVSTLPTRAGLPLAMGLLFVSLFIIVSRKKAVTQLIGFLMLENAIALLAVVGTYGVPLLVEFGVFLDALMGFLVMQIFVYHIHETFDTLDVEQLTRLRHRRRLHGNVDRSAAGAACRGVCVDRRPALPAAGRVVQHRLLACVGRRQREAVQPGRRAGRRSGRRWSDGSVSGRRAVGPRRLVHLVR